MENFEEKKEELKTSRKALVIDFIVLISGIVLFIILLIIGSNIESITGKNICTILGFVIFITAIIFSFIIEIKSVVYFCPNCKCVFRPTATAIIFSRRKTLSKKLRCPNCNVKTWMNLM